MRLSLATILALAIAIPVSAQVKTQMPEVQESVVKTDGKPARTAPKTIDVEGGPAPIWIWAKADSTPQKCWLRKEFKTTAASAAMIATCDNGMEIFLNGKRILSSTEWGAPVKADVTKHLKTGPNDVNEIRVDATNEGNVAGFALKLIMKRMIILRDLYC